MNGKVDEGGRAIVAVSLFSSEQTAPQRVDAWIDTGFTGDLVLPEQQIESLGLVHSGTVKAILADGSEVVLKTYGCLIDWFERRIPLEVVANEGAFPLLGVGLLLGHELRISYTENEVVID